jgi:hypothetical protein
MKKILSILVTLLISVSIFAQLPAITSKIHTIGPVSENGLTIAINPSLADSLGQGDTLFYKIQTSHQSAVYPYISLIEKVGIGRDTTVTLTFWQSVDGVHNWVQVLNTTTPTAWVTTLSKATATDIDFWRSVGWFSSTYLGVRLIGNGKKAGYTYNNKYYGSIRLNKI